MPAGGRQAGQAFGRVPPPGRGQRPGNRRKIQPNTSRIAPAIFTAPTRLGATMATMRVIVFVVCIFVFVAADITVNNGASFRGWLYYLATLMRTSGVL
ncbi:MAG: hypothetical protein WD036_03270 [Bauldia sp.]